MSTQEPAGAELADVIRALELARDACADVLHLNNNVMALDAMDPQSLWVLAFKATVKDAQIGYDAAETALAAVRAGKERG